MALYKVLQDIEAEDTLVGPLTLRQCIYAAVAASAGWLSYLCIIHPGAQFLVVFLMPFIAVGVFFAFPWKKEQSTEVWALAKVRFMLKPRKRIWDQSGMKHLVEVIVPKVAEDPRRHRMSQNEVQSRLKALAATVDSRGWATRNVPLDMYAQSSIVTPTDRLTGGSAVMNMGPTYTESYSDDMFDLEHNPIAQQFAAKISATSAQHRQQIVTQMANPDQPLQQPAQPTNWYLPQQNIAPQAPIQPVVPAASYNPQAGFSQVAQVAEPTAEELAFAEELKRRQTMLYENTTPQVETPAVPVQAPAQAVYAPVETAPAAPVQPVQIEATLQPQPGPAATVTPPVNPAILELANNNDLNVATIAREAQHRTQDGGTEVVVSLH